MAFGKRVCTLNNERRAHDTAYMACMAYMAGLPCHDGCVPPPPSPASQVFHPDQPGENLFPVPGTAAEFFTDMHRLLRYSSLGPVKSYCHHRLLLLEQKFNLHVMLNADKEFLAQKAAPHRDFYNVRKVSRAALGLAGGRASNVLDLAACGVVKCSEVQPPCPFAGHTCCPSCKLVALISEHAALIHAALASIKRLV